MIVMFRGDELVQAGHGHPIDAINNGTLKCSVIEIVKLHVHTGIERAPHGFARCGET